jgi:cyclin-dependent kinase 12/13
MPVTWLQLWQSEQLAKIWDLCGSPDEVNWPGVSRLQLYNQLKPERHKHRRVKDVFKHFDWHALDLLERMLTLDPLQVCPVSDLSEFLRKQPSM